ncbi:peptide ABC transporter ATPase [Amnibacterium flavum]|uniref:Peptide ABC transporter ATPase n=1 Tax=Amnibacterium flavum TaxID=2173173 RepID=A0A2V1HY40_9MICO|nr:peptide ABC transporter ATPase [Amnibacterium flavum]
MREPVTDAPVLLVHGNCQAESVRILLDAGDVEAVRMPPVHELTSDDIPHLAHWVARADYLVSQPVADDYHGLPVGTRQLVAGLRAGARVARFPVIRFAGLYPTQAIIRPPADPGTAPPVVPYHDLITLARAAGLDVARDHTPTPAMVRTIAEESIAQLTRREEAHSTVLVSDLFTSPRFALMRTINHPGNALLAPIAERVRDSLGIPAAAVDPGRQLLSGVQAPRIPAVIEAFGLDEPAEPDWIVDGTHVPPEVVEAAQLDWYRSRPDVVEAGLTRHAGALRALGLL